MTTPLRPQGFYRVKVDNRPGVAYCKHHRGWKDEEAYVMWSVMFTRQWSDGESYVATTTLSQRDPTHMKNFLVVGPIDG